MPYDWSNYNKDRWAYEHDPWRAYRQQWDRLWEARRADTNYSVRWDQPELWDQALAMYEYDIRAATDEYYSNINRGMSEEAALAIYQRETTQIAYDAQQTMDQYRGVFGTVPDNVGVPTPAGAGTPMGGGIGGGGGVTEGVKNVSRGGGAWYLSPDQDPSSSAQAWDSVVDWYRRITGNPNWVPTDPKTGKKIPRPPEAPGEGGGGGGVGSRGPGWVGNWYLGPNTEGTWNIKEAYGLTNENLERIAAGENPGRNIWGGPAGEISSWRSHRSSRPSHGGIYKKRKELTTFGWRPDGTGVSADEAWYKRNLAAGKLGATIKARRGRRWAGSEPTRPKPTWPGGGGGNASSGSAVVPANQLINWTI